MRRKPKPPRSRLREKAARGPQAFAVRHEQVIARYLDEVARLESEPARSHRFSQLLADLFSDVEFPVITEYLSGLETVIAAHDAATCRVSRGRPDALFGNVVVEFERKLPDKLKEAQKQLENYVAILRRNPATQHFYFAPIATDGVFFRVFAPAEGGWGTAATLGEETRLEKIDDFDASERAPGEFYYWLDSHFCRRVKREPRAENFVKDFGTGSPAFREAAALWSEAAGKIREEPDFRVVYENWRRYLRIAYGSEVGDLPLFIRHTFLATLAKLIAYVRLAGAQAPGQETTQEIMEGSFFEKQGVMNFLEEDFFSWVARPPAAPATLTIASGLVGLLLSYNLRELSEDVMKELYQQIVGKEERHALGEYYTPDWLAARMCLRLLDDSGEQSVLDPACGSGTFLYQAIQHKKRRLPHTRASLEKILGSVVGIDIHPLAVIVSKMNVLLALGDLFQKRRGALAIQVYLANSIRHPQKQPVLGEGGIPVERVELNEREVLIPDAALSSAASLDRAIRLCHEFAKAHRESQALNPDAFASYASREAREENWSADVVRMLFQVSQTLHGFIRKPEDTIWAYILRNQYRPTFLKGQFDVVVGNPPWLSFRFVEKGEWQGYLKRLIVAECRLLEGAGHLITHLELSTLFFVRCATLYLKATGKIGFVLPRSIFTADQHDRFRRSTTTGNVTLTEVWDLEQVSPLFNVPAAVAIGDLKSDAKKELPGQIFKGELKRKNASWAEAEGELEVEPTEFYVVRQGKRSFLSTSRKKISAARSYYAAHFKEGATIVPRSFWFVEFRADPKLGIDAARPLVATDPRAEAEAKPLYKGTHFEGAIEAEFLYATLLSTDLLPFGHFDFRPVVLPLVEEEHGYRMLTTEQARTRGFLRLAEWLVRAQQNWESHRKEKAKRGDALAWLNYRNKLTDQNPKAKHVVLYPKSATFLCAAVLATKAAQYRVGAQKVQLRHFLADHVTYFFETEDPEQASFLAAILNSPTIDALIKPMQARGLWGPRDIHKKVWELPIPEYRESNRNHLRLAEIAEECAGKVGKLVPSLRESLAGLRGPRAIGRARTAVRQALKDELTEIDALVRELLK